MMKPIKRLGTTVLILTLSTALPGCGGDHQSSTVPVQPLVQTDEVVGSGDAADDPAVWIHPVNRQKSLILGTDKRYGLLVFDLAGNEIQRLALGRLNNIAILPRPDVLDGYAVGTHYSVHEIVVFGISATSGLVSILYRVPTRKMHPYGICATTDRRKHLVAVTYKDGTLEIGELIFDGERALLRNHRTLRLESQLEGCVFDDHSRRLFVGEEDRGIWVVEYNDPGAHALLIDEVGSPSGLSADVEGLAIWQGRDGRGWLVASAQGRSAFVVYDLAPPYQAKGSFRIAANPGLSSGSVTHTDGVDVVSVALPDFPRGLLVAQDDNEAGSAGNQNFKLIHWGDVEIALSLPVYEMY